MILINLHLSDHSVTKKHISAQISKRTISLCGGKPFRSYAVHYNEWHNVGDSVSQLELRLELPG